MYPPGLLRTAGIAWLVCAGALVTGSVAATWGMEGCMWIVAAASLVGTWANARRRRWCFLLWFPANAAWTLYDTAAGLWPQAAVMATYAALAVWGWYEWGRDEGRD